MPCLEIFTSPSYTHFELALTRTLIYNFVRVKSERFYSRLLLSNKDDVVLLHTIARFTDSDSTYFVSLSNWRVSLLLFAAFIWKLRVWQIIFGSHLWSTDVERQTIITWRALKALKDWLPSVPGVKQVQVADVVTNMGGMCLSSTFRLIMWQLMDSNWKRSVPHPLRLDPFVLILSYFLISIFRNTLQPISIGASNWLFPSHENR